MRFSSFLVPIAAFALASCGVSRSSAIDTTREWARLAELPVVSTEVEVEVLGSPFSREFRLSFEAPIDSIDAWLEASEGIAGARTAEDGSTIRYMIDPGGGAQFAEVSVDRDRGQVRIRAYWS